MFEALMIVLVKGHFTYNLKQIPWTGKAFNIISPCYDQITYYNGNAGLVQQAKVNFSRANPQILTSIIYINLSKR